MKNFALLFIVIFLSSCTSNTEKKFIKYSTDSDSTLIYYKKGWKQILDFGDYTAAEVSYRKALTFDSIFW